MASLADGTNLCDKKDGDSSANGDEAVVSNKHELLAGEPPEGPVKRQEVEPEPSAHPSPGSKKDQGGGPLLTMSEAQELKELQDRKEELVQASKERKKKIAELQAESQVLDALLEHTFRFQAAAERFFNGETN